MDQQTSSSTKSAPSDTLVTDVTSQGGNTAILISTSKRLQQLHECPIPRTMFNMNCLPRVSWLIFFGFGLCSCGLVIHVFHTIWCRGAAERCFAKEILQCQLRTPIPAEDLGVVTKGYFIGRKEIPVDKFNRFVENMWNIDKNKYQYMRSIWGSLKLSVPKSQASN